MGSGSQQYTTHRSNSVGEHLQILGERGPTYVQVVLANCDAAISLKRISLESRVRPIDW